MSWIFSDSVPAFDMLESDDVTLMNSCKRTQQKAGATANVKHTRNASVFLGPRQGLEQVLEAICVHVRGANGCIKPNWQRTVIVGAPQTVLHKFNLRQFMARDSELSYV